MVSFFKIIKFQKSVLDDPHFMEKSEIRWIRLEDLLIAIKETDQISSEKLCNPKDVDSAIYIGGEKLPLAHDFAETMTILYREAKSSLNQLMRDKTVLSPVLVSDQKPLILSRL